MQVQKLLTTASKLATEVYQNRWEATASRVAARLVTDLCRFVMIALPQTLLLRLSQSLTQGEAQ